MYKSRIIYNVMILRYKHYNINIDPILDFRDINFSIKLFILRQ